MRILGEGHRKIVLHIQKELETGASHSVAMWLGARSLLSQCLDFPFYRLVYSPHSPGGTRDSWADLCGGLSPVPGSHVACKSD